MRLADRLTAIAEHAASLGSEADATGALRAAFPDLHFTVCQDEEVDGPPPVWREQAFNLYLVDSRDHCLRITEDPDVATGVVVAYRDPEEDALD